MGTVSQPIHVLRYGGLRKPLSSVTAPGAYVDRVGSNAIHYTGDIIREAFHLEGVWGEASGTLAFVRHLDRVGESAFIRCCDSNTLHAGFSHHRF